MTEYERLKKQAEDAHREYPQYANYWDGWAVATVVKDVKTKMGLSFAAGDRVLIKPEIHDLSAVSYSRRKVKLGVTCYSFRTEMNTGIWLADVSVDFSEWPTVVEKYGG